MTCDIQRNRDMRMLREPEHLSLRDLGLFSPEKSQQKGDFINAKVHLGWVSRGGGQMLSTGAQQQDKGQRAQTNRKFHLTLRKNFFTLRLSKHWKRLHREVVVSPPALPHILHSTPKTSLARKLEVHW